MYHKGNQISVPVVLVVLVVLFAGCISVLVVLVVLFIMVLLVVLVVLVIRFLFHYKDAIFDNNGITTIRASKSFAKMLYN